jgi:hypothetical protein
MDNSNRSLSAAEIKQLSVLIGARIKILNKEVAAQGKRHLADFEKKLSAKFSFDSDATWKKATAEVERVLDEANAEIAMRSLVLGIPAEFAPRLSIGWHERYDNASRERREELRRAAQAEITAKVETAQTKIEKHGLDLRIKIVAMGELSDAAKTFLETLRPVDEAVYELDFAAVDQKLLD